MKTNTDTTTELRAVYSQVNQAWLVIFGKKNAPIKEWTVTDINGRKIWDGEKRGRWLLIEDLARVGLRFVPGKANIIIQE